MKHLSSIFKTSPLGGIRGGLSLSGIRGGLLLVLLLAPAFVQAQGITPDLLSRLRTQQAADKSAPALRNALAANGINALATNPNNPERLDTWFSYLGQKTASHKLSYKINSSAGNSTNNCSQS